MLLPIEARRLLQKAAETPIHDGDKLARLKAIEHATAKIKREYPQFFREDFSHDDDEACCCE